MATPKNGPRKRANGGKRPSRSHSGAWVLAGAVACFIGFFMVINSYSNNPPVFYVGLVLLVAGAVTALANAFRRDRQNQRGDGPN